ncbi:hypothetical protein FSP39_012726 [Pinctada imbricata]|uniref:Major facilitator superfamily (MFS) profile domain-containing protein n=1 Tax=Pinctada imbricata TaxID=66713 RepID=A0AA89BTR7_PINIB|nr:hypothetical protein FSP39_012726 [Pinctada imbricata]
MVANEMSSYSKVETEENPNNDTSDLEGQRTEQLQNSDDSSDSTKTKSKEQNYLEDVLSSFEFGKFHFKMMLVTCGAYFAYCSEIVVFIFLSAPLRKEWDLKNFVFPLLPLFGGVGGIIGEIICGILSDRIGRKKPFLVSLYTVAIFGVLSAFAPSFPVIIAFRFMVFVGSGALAAVVFVLLLEFLPKKKRGTCMVAVTFSGALGALFASGMSWWFLPTDRWRVFVGTCAIPAVVVCIYTPFLVEESPRYLFLSNQKSAGLKVLNGIANGSRNRFKEGEIICASNNKRGRVQDLFKRGSRLKTLIIGAIWFLQATGYWGVTVYLPEYMGSLGIDPYFNMFTIFIGELPGMVLAMILVEPYMFGRVRCLQFFSLFTFLSLIVFAFVNLTFLKSVFVIVCYFFMVPIYSLLNTYTPEVYPTMFRTTAMAMFNIVIEIPGLVTPFIGEYLVTTKDTKEWLYPVVWASVFFLQFLFTLGLRYETAGKNIHDQDPNDLNEDSSETSV